MSFTVISWCKAKESNTDWSFPTKCNPCACIWSASSGGSGGIWYDPANDLCGKPFWGLAAANPGSMATPGSVVTGSFRMPLQGYKYYAGTSYTDPGPAPALGGIPFYPVPLNITMNGMPVFTFDPAAGSTQNFVVTSSTSGYCVFNPAPMAAAGWPAFYNFWTADSVITMPGIQLATPDNPYQDGSYDDFGSLDSNTYRCVVPYTGPLPIEAGLIHLAADKTAPWTASQDSGIAIYNCSDNRPITDFNPTAYPNFLNTSTCNGVHISTLVPNQKFQWLP
jgi:hypothetical protein